MHIHSLLSLSLFIVTTFGYVIKPSVNLEPGKYRLLLATNDQSTMVKTANNNNNNNGGNNNGNNNAAKHRDSYGNGRGYDNDYDRYRDDRYRDDRYRDDRYRDDRYRDDRYRDDRYRDDRYRDDDRRDRHHYNEHDNEDTVYVVENKNHHVPGMFEVGGGGGRRGDGNGWGWGPGNVAGHFFDSFGHMVGGTDYNDLEVHPVRNDVYEIGKGKDALTYLPDGSVVIAPNKHHRNQRFTLEKIIE
ncbi:hypothetical protein BJ944DRAFT_286278 [Cunninghamella echinulata]|nr:hypothetical protein BJ944DRAFT_286278 [Cunninghamella echinulata]